MSDGSNGYDRGLLEQLLTEIDQADADLASLKGEYMQNCKGPRETIAGVHDRAKDAGIPSRPFKTLVKNRRLDKQVAANIAKLEADQQSELEQLEVALGDFLDTDLGQAAARRARPDAEAALDNLAAP